MFSFQACARSALLFVAAILAVLYAASDAQASSASPQSDSLDVRPNSTAPEVEYDVNLNGYIDHEELRAIIGDFFSLKLPHEDLIRLLQAYINREYILPPSIADLIANSEWYADESEELLDSKEKMLRAYSHIDFSYPRLARLVSRWTWAFGDNISPHEVDVFYRASFSLENAPTDMLTMIGDVPWLVTGFNEHEGIAISYIMTDIRDEEFATAEYLLAAEWLTDGVDERERTMVQFIRDIYYADTVGGLLLFDLLTRSLVSVDYEILGIFSGMAKHSPELWNGLIMQDWFLDGLDKSEEAYLVAVFSAGDRKRLLEPFEIVSSTTKTPLGSDVRTWTICHANAEPINNLEQAVDGLEAAIWGAEELTGLAFPRDDVIMYLEEEPEEFGGFYAGSAIMVGVYSDEVSLWTIYHEVGHYYFSNYFSSSGWYSEGGASLTDEYIRLDGQLPETVPNLYCGDKHGLDNLFALEVVFDRDELFNCQYSMGMHFLKSLLDVIGREAWSKAVRDLISIQRGYHEPLGQELVGEPNPEDIYQAFMKHTSPDSREPALELWRELHAGPYVEGVEAVRRDSSPDEAALIALYEALDGDNWSINYHWLDENVPIGAWHGVSANRDGRVVELLLERNLLNGDLPPEIGDLTKLQKLDLSSNNISAELPTALGNLANLESLNLAHNNFSGSLPGELGHLTSLWSLELGNNQFSGPIPSEFGNMTALVSLGLSHSGVSGEIPSELGNLAKLSSLHAYGNRLTGEIPVELGNLTSLIFMELGENNLSGDMPIELGSLKMLKYLDLRENSISGISPLSEMTNLIEANLDGNDITDLSPLVANEAIGDDFDLYIAGNPLSKESLNIHIPELQARGVEVYLR